MDSPHFFIFAEQNKLNTEKRLGEEDTSNRNVVPFGNKNTRPSKEPKTMNATLKAIWYEDDAVLSFEWVLLVSLLTIGIVAGIAGARDAIVDELSDIAHAAISFDQSYTIAEFTTALITAGGFSYTDDTAADLAIFLAGSCDRTSTPFGQTPSVDDAGGP
ncbi:MAG: hypothetical protein ACI9HK_000384 [Pirellulaceae bacterium]